MAHQTYTNMTHWRNPTCCPTNVLGSGMRYAHKNCGHKWSWVTRLYYCSSPCDREWEKRYFEVLRGAKKSIFHNLKWRFPKIGVPLFNHTFLRFSTKSTIQLLGTPHDYGNLQRTLAPPEAHTFHTFPPRFHEEMAEGLLIHKGRNLSWNLVVDRSRAVTGSS